MAAVEIEQPSGDSAHSTSFRLLPAGRAPRIRGIDPGLDLGTALRRARRRRRISLERAARDTRIATRYLTALEQGGRLEEFPAPMYARAFLRAYARYLRIDADPLLQLLAPYEPPPVAPTLRVLTRVAPERGPRGRVVALLGAAALSVLLVLGSQDPLARPGGADAARAAEPIPSIVSLPLGLDRDVVAPHAGAPASASGIATRVTGRSWLRVTVGGRVVFEGTAAEGWTRTFDASEKIEILIGNAAAFELTVAGEPFGRLGAVGEVRRVVVTPTPEGPRVTILDRRG